MSLSHGPELEPSGPEETRVSVAFVGPRGNGSQPRVFRSTSRYCPGLKVLVLLSWASEPLSLWPRRLLGKERQLKPWGFSQKERKHRREKLKQSLAPRAPAPSAPWFLVLARTPCLGIPSGRLPCVTYPSWGQKETGEGSSLRSGDPTVDWEPSDIYSRETTHFLGCDQKLALSKNIHLFIWLHGSYNFGMWVSSLTRGQSRAPSLGREES